MAQLMSPIRATPYVLVLSGPAGSGKSTVATTLWKALPERPAYLDLDTFKNFVWQAPSDDYHLSLASRNGLAVMRNYLDAHTSVIIDKAFGRYCFVKPFIGEGTRRGVSTHYFKLTAPLSVLIERNRRRREYSSETLKQQARWRPFTAPDENIERMYNFFLRYSHPEGTELDTSSLSVDEVVETVRKALHPATNGGG